LKSKHFHASRFWGFIHHLSWGVLTTGFQTFELISIFLLDEEGGLRQILLQHTKREELLCLELEDKSFMGMNFRKATVQI
jgi:hypothetical protein